MQSFLLLLLFRCSTLLRKLRKVCSMRWKRVELDAQYPALCPLMLEVETVMGEEQVG